MLAVRGSPVKSAISPKKSPSRSVLMVRCLSVLSTRTSTLPRWTTNIEAPLSPARMIVSPGAKTRPDVFSASAFSSSAVSGEKMSIGREAFGEGRRSRADAVAAAARCCM